MVLGKQLNKCVQFSYIAIKSLQFRFHFSIDTDSGNNFQNKFAERLRVEGWKVGVERVLL